MASSVYFGLRPRNPSFVRKPYHPRLALDFVLDLRGCPGSSANLGGSIRRTSGTKIVTIGLLVSTTGLVSRLPLVVVEVVEVVDVEVDVEDARGVVADDVVLPTDCFDVWSVSSSSSVQNPLTKSIKSRP